MNGLKPRSKGDTLKYHKFSATIKKNLRIL